MSASVVRKIGAFNFRLRVSSRTCQYLQNLNLGASLSTQTDGSSVNKNGGSGSELSARDPFPLFSSTDVQSLLSRITGFDLMKISGPHLAPMERPVYKLLTDAELKKEQEDARERLKYRLQMPPYMNARKPVTTNIVDDPDLAGFDTSKFVFVDCSFGIKDRQRSVVVRETDGSLRQAPWDVKERMNQIYNPREGRNVIKPKMFQEENLERMIEQKRYEYILNRACAQFEPDDPDFIRTSHRVYNAVDSSQDFDTLRSTRFFGPLAFYLVWHQMCDSLVLDMLNRNLLDDAVDVVRLFCYCHPDSSYAESLKSLDTSVPEVILKAYIDSESKTKSDLRTSLEALMDRLGGQREPSAQSSS